MPHYDKIPQSKMRKRDVGGDSWPGIRGLGLSSLGGICELGGVAVFTGAGQ